MHNISYSMPKRKLSESQSNDVISPLSLCQNLVNFASGDKNLSPDFIRWCLLQLMKIEYGSPSNFQLKLKNDAEIRFYEAQIKMLDRLVLGHTELLEKFDPSVILWLCSHMLGLCSRSGIPQSLRKASLALACDLVFVSQETVPNLINLCSKWLKDIILESENVREERKVTGIVVLYEGESQLTFDCPTSSPISGPPILINRFCIGGLTFMDCQCFASAISKVLVHFSGYLDCLTPEQLSELLSNLFSVLRLGDFNLKEECLWAILRLISHDLVSNSGLISLMNILLGLIEFTLHLHKTHETSFPSNIVQPLVACLNECAGKMRQSVDEDFSTSNNIFLKLSPGDLGFNFTKWMTRIRNILSSYGETHVSMYYAVFINAISGMTYFCAKFGCHFPCEAKKNLCDLMEEIVMEWLPNPNKLAGEDLTDVLCACIKACILLQPNQAILAKLGKFVQQFNNARNSADVCLMCTQAMILLEALSKVESWEGVSLNEKVPLLEGVSPLDKVSIVLQSVLDHVCAWSFLFGVHTLMTKSSDSLYSACCILDLVHQLMLRNHCCDCLTSHQLTRLVVFIINFVSLDQRALPTIIPGMKPLKTDDCIKNDDRVYEKIVTILCCVSRAAEIDDIQTVRIQFINQALNGSNANRLRVVLHHLPVCLVDLTKSQTTAMINQKLLPLLPVIEQQGKVLLSEYLSCVQRSICVQSHNTRIVLNELDSEWELLYSVCPGLETYLLSKYNLSMGIYRIAQPLIVRPTKRLCVDCFVCGEDNKTVDNKENVNVKLLNLLCQCANRLVQYSSEIRASFAEALVSLLRHCNMAIDKPDVTKLLKDSMVLIEDNSFNVRTEFGRFLEQVSGMKFGDEMSGAIQESLFLLNPEQIKENMPWAVLYLGILINCNNCELADICLVKLVLLVTFHAANMQEARGHMEKVCAVNETSLTDFYRSKAYFVWTHVIGDIIDELKHSNNISNEFIKRRFVNVARLFLIIPQEFTDDQFKVFVRGIIRYVYPILVLRRSEMGTKIMSDVARFLDTNRFDLISERANFKYIFAKVIRTGENTDKYWDYLCKQGDNVQKVGDIVSGQYFHCASYLLLFLSENESLVVESVQQLATDEDDIEGKLDLGTFLHHRMQWQLFIFHEIFTKAEPHNDRTIAVRSLELLIRKIKGRLLERYRSKCLAVLMAASEMHDLRSSVVQVWVTLITSLTPESVAELLPQIVVCTLSLHKDRKADTIFHTLFKNIPNIARAKYLTEICSVLVGIPKYKDIKSFLPTKFTRIDSSASHIAGDIQHCITLLNSFQMSEIKILALERLVEILDGPEWHSINADNLTGDLVDMVLCLITTVRHSSHTLVLSLSLKCFGLLGAIDPGKLGLELSSPTLVGRVPRDCRPPPILYPHCNDNRLSGEFCRSLLSRMSVSVESMTSSFKYDSGICCIRGVLEALSIITENVNVENREEVWDKLDENVRMILEPAMHTKFRLKKPPAHSTDFPSPIYGSAFAVKFSHWITNCMYQITKQLPPGILANVFMNCCDLADIDANFGQFLLPPLVLQCLLLSSDFSPKLQNEMRAVLDDCSKCSGDRSHMQQLAAQAVFSTLDYLARWPFYDHGEHSYSKHELDYVCDFVSSFEAESIWKAAAGCKHYSRAVLAFEHEISRGKGVTDEQVRGLQQLYVNVDDSDAVIGALEYIKQLTQPNINDQILAVEAVGNYTESLPLHQQRAEKSEAVDDQLALISCLLKLNQPHLVQNYIRGLEAYNKIEARDEKMLSHKAEALRKLEKWDDLDKLVRKDESNCGDWQMILGRVLGAFRKEDQEILESELTSARQTLLAPMQVSAMEVGAYERAYTHICRLAILAEVKQASDVMWKGNNHAKHDIGGELDVLFKQWNVRSKYAQHSPGTQEPILEVRRTLITLASLKSPLMDGFKQRCWIESAEVARKAAHLQRAWGFLVNSSQECPTASNSKTRLEEAKLAWSKENKEDALCLLAKNLKENFNFVAEQASGMNGRCNDKQFCQTLTLYMDYAYKAGAKTTDDMKKLYLFVQKHSLNHEALLYQMANFYDTCKTSTSHEQVHAFLETLKHGSRHLHHAMPRMLTLWLDTSRTVKDSMTLEKQNQQLSSKYKEKYEEAKQSLPKINRELEEAFKNNKLPCSYFYSAFSQLTSRIETCEPTALKVLQDIISGLMVELPEQCLWLIIGIYNAAVDGTPRKQRLEQVFKLARNAKSGKSMVELVKVMERLFSMLRTVTETKCDKRAGNGNTTKISMKDKFPDLYHYFRGGVNGKMRRPPPILAPLQSLLALLPSAPTLQPVESFSSTQSTSNFFHDLADHKVYIQSFEDTIEILPSLQKPKKLVIRTSDGMKHSLLCKPGDDMRKDKRMIEFCRVVNSCLQENSNTRARQLHVRTFEIIPLGSSSGLVEFLDNMIVKRSVIFKTMTRRGDPPMSTSVAFTQLQSNPNVKTLEKLIQAHPPAIGQWLRMNFAEPCGWYAARQAFIRTAATMSMIGFIVGLGDRHSENVLIDRTTGDVFHVDFNCLFNKGEELGVPEMVPFRVTQHFVEAFGPLGVEGPFRKCCEAAMTVLRDKSRMLCNVLQTFLFDPLIEWAPSRSINSPTERHAAALAMTVKGKDVLKYIQARLEGQNVTPKGMVRGQTKPKEGEGLSVEGQVHQLISIATDPEVLCKMFPGWAPYL